jgi:hypothetical protein
MIEAGETEMHFGLWLQKGTLSLESSTRVRWCRVKWDNGHLNSYRVGAEGAFDLRYTHDTDVQELLRKRRLEDVSRVKAGIGCAAQQLRSAAVSAGLKSTSGRATQQSPRLPRTASTPSTCSVCAPCLQATRMRKLVTRDNVRVGLRVVRSGSEEGEERPKACGTVVGRESRAPWW